jgi:hypothetical protein
MKTDRFRSLAVALILMTVTALAFIAIHSLGETSGISSALSIVAGMAAMAALHVLAGYARSSERTKVVLGLDRDFVISAIAESVPLQLRHPVSPQPAEKANVVSARRLLSKDPTLAAAKLRIDIELALAELADSAEVPLDEHPRSLFRLAQELVSVGTLPHSLLYPIKQVSDICNRVIHGAEISSRQAAEVLDIGEALLTALRNLRSGTPSVPERQTARADE